MMRRVLSLGLIIGSGLLSGLIYAQWFNAAKFDTKLPMGSELIYSAALAICWLLILKVYCVVWERMAGRTYALNVYESIAVPVMVLAFPAITSYGGLHLDLPTLQRIPDFIYVVTVLTLWILADQFSFIRYSATEIVRRYGSGVERFCARNPPENRGDMWPIDVALNGFWIVLLGIHVFKT